MMARAPPASLVLLACLLFSLTEARDILVGGKQDAWTIPSSESESLNQWAESTRFRISNSLVWKYDGQKDSVMQVTREDYANCNISNPLKEYKDGNTKVMLERSGPYYFISGEAGHCQKGQKLVVVVLSPKHKRFPGISPAPSPAYSQFEGPAAAPTSGATSFHGSLLTVAFMLFGMGGLLM